MILWPRMVLWPMMPEDERYGGVDSDDEEGYGPFDYAGDYDLDGDEDEDEEDEDE